MRLQGNKRKFYTVTEGVKAAAKYCAYQERCQSEVRNFLQGRELSSEEVEEVIAELISDNFINEQRFAHAFTSGKFNIKKWGRIKIRAGLKAKGVYETCITEALNSIDENEYFNTLTQIAQKKAADKYGGLPLKTESKNKLFQYLLSRGFESELISETLHKIEQSTKND